MNKDYERYVELTCPLCGSTNWSSKDLESNSFMDFPDDHEFTCSYCNGSFKKSEIYEANHELIYNTIQELATDFMKDSLKDLQKEIDRINRHLK